jgi:hypothetical protein
MHGILNIKSELLLKFFIGPSEHELEKLLHIF